MLRSRILHLPRHLNQQACLANCARQIFRRHNSQFIIVQADEDLYGDLSGILQDTQPASTSAAAPGNVLAPVVAEKDLIQQEDAPAAQHVDVEGRDPVTVPATDRGNTPQVEEPEAGPPEALAVEDAFARIAEVVGKQSDSPKDVVLAVSSLASQVDAYRTSTAAQHQQHMAQQIQVCRAFVWYELRAYQSTVYLVQAAPGCRRSADS